MKIVVGLGNPGREYAQTRHNIGWMVLDRIADRAGWTDRVKSRDASASVGGRYHGLDLLLVKPQTYMNSSGLAVRKVLARERAPLGDLLVVVDDFNLPFGRLRLRESGSEGGHNGLRSIIGELGTEKFARMRIGIGAPAVAGAVRHVLNGFSAQERAQLDTILDAAADAVEDWARDGIARASNRWNAWQPALSDEPGGDGHASRSHLGAPESVPGAGSRRGKEPEIDEDPIRRTRTGWRRLLPPRDAEAER